MPGDTIALDERLEIRDCGSFVAIEDQETGRQVRAVADYRTAARVRRRLIKRLRRGEHLSYID